MAISKPSFENNAGNYTINLNDRTLLESIIRGEYILVIGSEAILKPDVVGTDGTGDSQRMVYNQMLSTRNDYKNGSWSEEKWRDYLNDRNRPFTHENVTAAVNVIDYQLDEISDELSYLIESKFFRVVFTTSIDFYLEKKMRQVWGDELRIFNFSGELNEINKFFYNYKKCQETDNLKDPIPPTLVYAFGQVPTYENGRIGCDYGYVFTDDEAIAMIARWIQSTSSNTVLSNYISNKYIMAIGCKFEDWQFRFFWYALTSKSMNTHSTNGAALSDDAGLRNMPICSNNTVAITYDPNTENTYRSLQNYLTHQVKVMVENDSRRFMRRIGDLITPIKQSEEWQAIFAKPDDRYLFISYAHEDFMMVYQLYLYLKNRCGFNVWMDRYDLHEQSKYFADIQNAINSDKCVAAIPFLSAQVASDLAGNNIDRFYISQEWTRLRERNALGMPILPITTHGYDTREAYHNRYKELWGIADTESDYTILSIDQINQYVADLKTILRHGTKE